MTWMRSSGINALEMQQAVMPTDQDIEDQRLDIDPFQNLQRLAHRVAMYRGPALRLDHPCKDHRLGLKFTKNDVWLRELHSIFTQHRSQMRRDS